jgi:hypothetical protein
VDSVSGSSFLRGLTIGALLGAVIAGSSLWQRRRRAARGFDDKRREVRKAGSAASLPGVARDPG